MKAYTTYLPLIIFFVLISNISDALNPQWAWGIAAGGDGDDRVAALACDSQGNLYATGFYGDSIQFGSTILRGGTYFLVKYDSSGNFRWAKEAQGYGEGYGIACDASNHIYVTGSYDGDSIAFDGAVIHNSDGAGFSEIFIVKYDSAGQVIWAKGAGGKSDETGYVIAVYHDTSVFVAGSFTSDTLIIGNDSLLNADISGFWEDIVIIKYDSSGRIQHTQREGGEFEEIVQAITSDPFGNVIITGYYGSDSIIFSSNTIYNNIGSGSLDYFIAKYNSEGVAQWAQGAGGSGTSYDYGTGVACDDAGNIYTSGDFLSDSLTFGTIRLEHAGMFLVKYNSSGTVQWAKCAGNQYSGSNFTYLVKGSDNSIIAGGNFTNTVFQLDNITLFNAQTSGLIFQDAFIAKYDTSGILQWARVGGGTGDDWVYTVAVDPKGHAYVGGEFNSLTMNFGPSVLNYSGGTGYDAFIGKLEKSLITGIIHQKETAERLTIFPNPAMQHFSIFTGNFNTGFLISIKDLIGNIVRSGTFTKMEMVTISTVGLPNGIYLVEVRSGDIKKTAKLVIAN